MSQYDNRTVDWTGGGGVADGSGSTGSGIPSGYVQDSNDPRQWHAPPESPTSGSGGVPGSGYGGGSGSPPPEPPPPPPVLEPPLPEPPPRILWHGYDQFPGSGITGWPESWHTALDKDSLLGSICRFPSNFVTFKERMIVVGSQTTKNVYGTEYIYPDNNILLWSSNGLIWKQGSLPTISCRLNPQLFVLGNYLYLHGGYDPLEGENVWNQGMWRTTNLVTWEEVLWSGHAIQEAKFVDDVRQLYSFMGRLYYIYSEVINENTVCNSSIKYYRDNNDILNNTPVVCSMPNYGQETLDSGLQLAPWSGVVHKGRFGVPGWVFNKNQFNEFYGLEANATATNYFAGWLVTTNGDTFYHVSTHVDLFTSAAAEAVLGSVNLGFNSGSPEFGNYYPFLKDYAMFGPSSYSDHYHNHGAYPMVSIDGMIVNLGANYGPTPGYDNWDGTNRYGNEVYRCDDFGASWIGYNIGPPGFYTGPTGIYHTNPAWPIMFGDRLFWGSLVDDSHTAFQANGYELDLSFSNPTCHLWSTKEGLFWTYDATVEDKYMLKRYKDYLLWNLTMQYMAYLYPNMNNNAILELLLTEFVYNPDDSLMTTIVWVDVQSALITAQLLYVNVAVKYITNLKAVYDYYAGYVNEIDIFSGMPSDPPPWLSIEEVRVALWQDIKPSIALRVVGSKDGITFLAGRLASAGSVDITLSSTKVKSYGAIDSELGILINPVRL
jgi:hypothetical protein